MIAHGKNNQLANVLLTGKSSARMPSPSSHG